MIKRLLEIIQKGKEIDSETQSRILLFNKQAELLALQNQINPHFLYNTLDAIRGDALKVGAHNIADITEALSIYFRYTISEIRSLVPLMEELDNVNNYLKIQQYRFGEKVQTETITSSDQVLGFMCPKLMLQPIVENAIFHGIEKQVGGGRITINIEEISNKLRIVVNDNGVGISEQRLKELNNCLETGGDEISRRGHGIALINVNKRIKLLFGEQYGIWVFSVEHIGTCVKVELPLIREADYEEGSATISEFKSEKKPAD
ncbi:sensor histidine kinase YesM [Lachnospiraceae bacterium PF1-22]|uniref:sensor histidine kinase n=1 Tax=Ohessyouella blattaphilus TaxID=2949333 RepID=UPI003E24573E